MTAVRIGIVTLSAALLVMFAAGTTPEVPLWVAFVGLALSGIGVVAGIVGLILERRAEHKRGNQ